MATPTIPINQQNTFPIQTVADATSPDQVIIIGGQVTKRWGPSSVATIGSGVSNGSVTIDANGHRFVVSNFLSAQGCSNFAALVTRGNATAVGLGALPAFGIWVQYRLTPVTTMPTSQPGGSIALDQCGMALVNSTLVTFTAMAQNDIQYGLVTWGPSTDAGSSAIMDPTAIGTDMRIFASWSTNVVDVNNKFSLTIWGSS